MKLTNLASAKRIAPGNFDEVSGALREVTFLMIKFMLFCECLMQL